MTCPRPFFPALLLLLFSGSAVLAQTPTVSTEAAINITDVSVTLNGNANPNGGVFHPSFDIGTPPSYGKSISASPSLVTGSSSTAITGTVNNLLPNTTYHYRLIGYNNGGPNIAGVDMVFTTGAPSSPPAFSGPTQASSIASAYARLSAVLRPGGSTATAKFEYGPTTAYGSTATDPSPKPVGIPGQPFVQLEGLTPATTYHYRCVATNAQGTTYSDDNTFTTLPAPIATTAAVTGLNDIAVTFNGSVNARGNSCSPTFEWGTTTSYGNVSVADPPTVQGNSTVTVSSRPSGLLPSTTYHYRIRVRDGGHTYYYGADRVFTTSAPMSPPTVGPINSGGSAPSTYANAMVYSVSAGGSPATVAFEYGPTIAYGSTQTYSSTIPTGTTAGYVSVTLTGLTPGTLYHYRAKVTNAQGTAYSVDGTFTTLALPAITTGAATSVTDLSVVLNGTANGNTRWVDLFFDLGTSTDYGSIITPTPSRVSGTVVTAVSVNYRQLLPNTIYHYRLRGVESDGTTYYGADATFTTGAPSTPPTIGFVFVDASATTATFLATDFFSGSSVATVTVEYGPTADYGSTALSSAVPINTQEYLAVPVGGLNPSTLYHYRYTAANSEGIVQTADATFTTPPLPVLATLPPTGVTNYTAALNGSANPSGGRLNVYFQYGTSAAYENTVSASPPFTYGTTTATHTVNIGGLLPSTSYHYRIVCVDGGGSYYYGADATFTSLSMFENWRQGFFGSASNTAAAADGASFSGDGVPNLLKYALGLDPTVQGAGLLPPIVLKNYGGASYLSYTFPRHPAKVDLTYEVVVAENVSGPWTTIASSVAGAPTTGLGFVAETPGTGDTVLVEVRDVESVTSAAQRFLRLKITH